MAICGTGTADLSGDAKEKIEGLLSGPGPRRHFFANPHGRDGERLEMRYRLAGQSGLHVAPRRAAHSNHCPAARILLIRAFGHEHAKISNSP
jgi:hypothetical protein